MSKKDYEQKSYNVAKSGVDGTDPVSGMRDEGY
jgi:hypothetical protein